MGSGLGLGVDPKHACGRAQAESIAFSKVSVLQLPSPPKPLTVHAQRVSATKCSRSIMYARRARSRSSALAASASGDVATAATRLMLRSPG